MGRLNAVSATITQNKSQGASQAMLYATGLTREDMDKPSSVSPACGTRAIRATCTSISWPAAVKEGVTEAGLVGMRFNTDRRLRRHFDGNRRHELLAAVT